MKVIKNRFYLIALLYALMLATACGTGPAPRVEAPVAEISGLAEAVDRYGNITADITTESFVEAGFELGDLVLLEAGAFRGVVPVVSNYADVNRGEPLVRLNPTSDVVTLAINMGNFAETNQVDEGAPIVIAMAQKGAYKAELEIRNLVRTENRADYASDAVFANFREPQLGNTAPNMIYRSSHPALNESDMATRAPYAARLAEQAGIATVINLTDTPEELPLRAATVPWYQGFIDRGSIIGLGLMMDYQTADFAAKLKAGFLFMLEQNPPYLIHCNEGKDRAGVVIALLGALMGATPEAIVEDYMLSYANYYGVTRDEERYALIASIMVDILADFNGGTAPAAGGTVAAAERYLSQVIGLTPAQISALKNKLAGN